MTKFVAAVAVSVALAPTARADLDILRGLSAKTFSVTVEPLDAESRKAGLTEAGLAKVVQSKLQKRGVKFAARTDTELFVRIVTLTSNDVTGKVLGYGAHTELSLREKAYLDRDKTRHFMAPTWFKGNVTVANPQQFVQQTVVSLSALTDQFLADYAAANK